MQEQCVADEMFAIPITSSDSLRVLKLRGLYSSSLGVVAVAGPELACTAGVQNRRTSELG